MSGSVTHESGKGTTHGGGGGTFGTTDESNTSTQISKILAWAETQIKSTAWSGRCQAFVARAYQAGTGNIASASSAKLARELWMKKGTANDLKPPAGAAVYFTGTPVNGILYGHVALSAGDGLIYDPVDHVYKSYLTKNMHNGYLGWGWNGGTRPTGASEKKDASNASYGGGSTENTALDILTGNQNSEKETVEISTVSVINETGTLTGKSSSSIGDLTGDDDMFLLIQGNDRIYKPLIADDVHVIWERTGAPGKMTFSFADIDGMDISEGNAVAFRYRQKKVFFGYIFTLERDSDREKVSVTCYDQLRYFKNKDNFVYHAKYSDMLKNNICKKYGFRMGTIEDTGYCIPTRLEDGSLFDICEDAASFTLLNNGKRFILFDDFGGICLRSMENMLLPILLDYDTTGKWTMKSTIDSDVANRIVLKKDNNETGVRELTIVNDGETQKKWGILVLEEDADENSTASEIQAKAKSLLKYYNRLNKTFRAEQCIGDIRVRGGSLLPAYFDIGNGKKIQNLMIVNKVEHTFSETVHTMDLHLFGGDFSA